MNEIVRATVIGGRGFIGSHVVRHFEQNDIPCWVPMPDDPELGRRDLGAVFYCAGVNAASTRPAFDAQRTHVAQLADVLDRGHFESLVYLSSTRVYLDAERGDEEAPLSVRPLAPDQLFNITKLAGEAICLGVARANVRVARVSNVFGAGARAVNFLPAIIEEAIRTGRVVLRSALASSKDYISIGDCVAGLVALAQRGTERITNVASGSNVSHAEILAVLTALTGAHVEVAPQSPAIVFPLIDVTRLRALVPPPSEHVLAAFADLVHAYKELA